MALKHLKGRIKTDLTDAGICHRMHCTDIVEGRFEVMIYVSGNNAYKAQVWHDRKLVHELPSYVDLFETFCKCDSIIDNIIESKSPRS